MRYPISEETKEPYGMPKGEKALDDAPADLGKVNQDKLKEAVKSVEAVDGLVRKGNDYLPKGEKPKADAPFTLDPTSKKSVNEESKVNPKKKGKK